MFAASSFGNALRFVLGLERRIIGRRASAAAAGVAMIRSGLDVIGAQADMAHLLGDPASEVWSRMGLALDVALTRMAAGWKGLKAAGLSRSTAP